MTVPNILEQGNVYLNAEGAVRFASAMVQNSSEIQAGTQWIDNPERIQPRSIISNECNVD
jgi:hypothetical protein